MLESDIDKYLGQGLLVLSIGNFSARLQSSCASVGVHLHDVYRDYSFVKFDHQLHDQFLNVRPPNLLRGLIKRQVIPDPGFQFPAVPLPDSMGALAFEMGLNISVALKTYNRLILHAGVVANDKGGVIISAASGGGKSTLTALLMQEGFRLLSDEFGIIELNGHTLLPYPRPVSLKNASIDVIKEVAGDGWISAVIKDGPKGNVAYRRARYIDIAHACETAVPKLIVFPKFEKGATAAVNKVASADTVMRLIASSTNYQIIGEDAFRAVNHIAKQAKAYEITYGSSADALGLFRAVAEGTVL
jgi:HprK-related kinase A